MKDCSFCYEKERFPQIKKENEQLKSELETYQILAHKRGECYLSSLREIKKQKEEKEQLKQKYEENKLLAKRICELQSDLSSAKSQSRLCENYNDEIHNTKVCIDCCYFYGSKFKIKEVNKENSNSKRSTK